MIDIGPLTYHNEGEDCQYGKDELTCSKNDEILVCDENGKWKVTDKCAELNQKCDRITRKVWTPGKMTPDLHQVTYSTISCFIPCTVEGEKRDVCVNDPKGYNKDGEICERTPENNLYWVPNVYIEERLLTCDIWSDKESVCCQ